LAHAHAYGLMAAPAAAPSPAPALSLVHLDNAAPACAASAGELVLGREDLREADREGPDANKVSRRARGGQLTLALGSDGEWRARSREGALWPAGLQRRGSRPEPIAAAEPVALRHGDVLYLVSQPLLKRYPLLVRLPPSGDCVAADCEAARRRQDEWRLRDGSFHVEVCELQPSSSTSAAHASGSHERASGTLTLTLTPRGSSGRGGTLAARWCEGRRTFGTDPAGVAAWAELPVGREELQATVRRHKIHSGWRELLLRSERSQPAELEPIRMEELHAPPGVSHGASLLLDLLQRKERLEAARAAQRARTEALQAELSAADETLSAKVEQMRAEEAEVWSDFLPLLHAKRARLRKLEADALERDLSLSDVEAGAGHGGGGESD